jgi:hypothetical protein
MTKKIEKKLTRRISAFALLAALLAGGGIIGHQSATADRAADGPARCCN